MAPVNGSRTAPFSPARTPNSRPARQGHDRLANYQRGCSKETWMDVRFLKPDRLLWVEDRGRDAHYWAPPAQIRTCGIPAYGSYRE